MVYVYDVLVNLNSELYDFYDWEEDDNFYHVRRCPIFRVSSDTLSDFCFKKVKVNTDFLNNIKDKTQVFSSKNVEVISYMTILSDTKKALCVMFNSNGNIIKLSNFLVNEELEILEISNSLNLTNINYSVNGKIRKQNMIRKEKIILDNIIEELTNIKDDKEKIDYLYYEWFDKKEGNNKFESLVKDLKKRFTNRHLELLELINLLTVKK